MAKKKDNGAGGELVVLPNPNPTMPTRDGLVLALEDHRVMALRDGAYSAANQSVALQAKLLGMIVDKHQVEHLGSYAECRTLEEIETQFAIEYGEAEAQRVVGTYKRITHQRRG
jgi:hypothetical protein